MLKKRKFVSFLKMCCHLDKLVFEIASTVSNFCVVCGVIASERPQVSSYVTTDGKWTNHKPYIGQLECVQWDITPSSKRSDLFKAVVETPFLDLHDIFSTFTKRRCTHAYGAGIMSQWHSVLSLNSQTWMQQHSLLLFKIWDTHLHHSVQSTQLDLMSLIKHFYFKLQQCDEMKIVNCSSHCFLISVSKEHHLNASYSK